MKTASLFPRVRIPSWQIWLARCSYLTAFMLGYVYYDYLQYIVDISWLSLRATWLFNCVYFETWWTSFVYPPILLAPYLMSKIAWFDQYKLDPKMVLPKVSTKTIIRDAIVYNSPLMFLDTFMVKQYTGVGIDPMEWSTRRQTLIQSTRALPSLPPTVTQIFGHLVASFILYDLLFFGVHYILHKNLKLYHIFHKHHHDHKYVHSKITNQLHIVERIALVLSANQALRIMHAHPLTRMIFVPFFIGWITENHCGYDLPWTLDKVVPFGLVGGSPAHFAHHQYGERNYQPFFTYIDRYLMSRSKVNSYSASRDN